MKALISFFVAMYIGRDFKKLKQYMIAQFELLEDRFSKIETGNRIVIALLNSIQRLQQEMYTFMDSENYEQYSLHSSSIEEQIKWLADGLEGITALLVDGIVICIEVPSSVELEITETAPEIKGATVTNRNKPALLENGITVQIPEYLSTGDMIQVNTETEEFMSRVKVS